MSFKMIQARMKAIEAEFEEYEFDKPWAILSDFIEPYARDQGELVGTINEKYLEDAKAIPGMDAECKVWYEKSSERWCVQASGHGQFDSKFNIFIQEEDLYEAGGVLRAIADAIEKEQRRGYDD